MKNQLLPWFSDSVARLYQADHPAAIAAAGITIIHERFGAVISGLEEMGLDMCSYQVHGVRGHEALPPDYAAFVHDHPATNLILGGTRPPIVHLSRDIPRQVWERTDHYQGLARRLGWQDQLAIVSCSPTSFAVWGFWRDRRFTPEEQEIAAHLQVHFHAAWSRLQTPPAAAAPMRSCWITVADTPQPVPVGLEPAHDALLRAYFPGSRPSHRLPTNLARWVSSTLAQLRRQPPLAPLRALIVSSARGQLHVRLFPASAGRPLRLKLAERAAQPNFFRLQALGLTPRECEILHWISLGKRDQEIASILTCAPATISKHVEHLLAKLHAETRGAACHAALLWLGRN